MITAGVDLAAEPKKTGLARIRWQEGGATVEFAGVGGSDDDIKALIGKASKTGIDCPFGWPRAFIEFVTAHQTTHVSVVTNVAPATWRRTLCYRETDLRVKQEKLQGLSVAADRIGVTTMRCAALLSQLAAEGTRVGRAGDGDVVEVYPSASLKMWGLSHRGYKQSKGRATLSELVDALLSRATWLSLDVYEDLCRRSDDAFDAVVCALTARAFECGLVEPIPERKHEVAQVEGWIALPRGDLRDLAQGPQPNPVC